MCAVRHHQSFRRRSRRGLAISEAAIVLPVFVVLSLGALEICSAIFAWQSVSVAAYEGVRVATRPFATNDDVEDHCDVILSARDIVDYDVEITVGGADADLSAIAPGASVTVTVSAPASANAVLLLPVFQGRILSHSVTMLKE